ARTLKEMRTLKEKTVRAHPHAPPKVRMSARPHAEERELRSRQETMFAREEKQLAYPRCAHARRERRENNARTLREKRMVRSHNLQTSKEYVWPGISATLSRENGSGAIYSPEPPLLSALHSCFCMYVYVT